MLNRDVLARDPTGFTLADGGVAKVSFPPEPDTLAVLREQLEMFVCEGAYADALRRILEGFNAVAAGKSNTPAVWISGFYGSGKSLLAAMLAALWTDFEFPDGRRAEGLVHNLPTEVAAALKELRTIAKRKGLDLVVGGTTLGSGAGDPVKAILGVLLRAAGLPSTADLRPMLCALWLADQGVLDSVRTALGDAFPRALEAFLLDDRIAAAAVAAKPALGTTDAVLDRLNAMYAQEPEATPDLLLDKGRQALTLGGRPMPLTLIVLDEVQQFIREDANRSLAIQTIAENLAARFDGRVLLVCTGQSALGDTPYLDRLLGRFSIRLPLGSADIQSVIRKTLLRKKPEQLPAVQAMIDGASGELDRHLQGSPLRRTEADRLDAAADWPLLATRRRVWDRVLQELDRSGLGGTLRSQLRVTLDSLKRYADRPLSTAVSGDFLLDTFGAEALSRQLIGGEFFDKVEIQRAQPGDGPLKARILLLAYMLARIAGDASTHGVRATADTFADLLIEDMGDAAAMRARVPGLLASLAADGLLIDVGGGEWRLQTKESADWQVAFNKARAELVMDSNAVARNRAEVLRPAIDDALTGAVRVMQGTSKTPRTIERVAGAGKPEGGGLVLRLWNEWEFGTAPLAEIQAADVNKDATLHLLVPIHRNNELTDAIVTRRAAERVLQVQGPPSTEGGREAKAAMEAKLAAAEKATKTILSEAVRAAQVLVAGGAEVGAGQPRAEAVLAAAARVLDRLYPDFGVADNGAWDRASAKAKAGAHDALKEVDHAGDAHLHPVCKALLKAMGSTKTGAELRKLFDTSPYGWPRVAVDTGLRMLALTGQVRVTGPDHKPADLTSVNDQGLGLQHFAPESRTVSASEKIAVRGLGTALGLKITSGEELANLIPIVDRLRQRAEAAGGPAPAPAPPSVPGDETFKTATGNDLLAELAARKPEFDTLLPAWAAAAKQRDTRMAQWALAETLIQLGAKAQAQEAQAIRTHRALLTEPDPIAPLVAAATASLVTEANAAHTAWRAAWEAGEAALKASDPWSRISPEKRHALRADHQLLDAAPPDLSTPSAVVTSLKARPCSQWRDMAAAHPGRVQSALQDAAVELEPKTQKITVPRPTLWTEAELDAWLASLRATIAALLSHGPVLPT